MLFLAASTSVLSAFQSEHEETSQLASVMLSYNDAIFWEDNNADEPITATT